MINYSEEKYLAIFLNSEFDLLCFISESHCIFDHIDATISSFIFLYLQKLIYFHKEKTGIKINA